MPWKSFTPELQLQTLFVLDDRRRIVSSRDPSPRAGPRFALIRDASGCAWATRVDVPDRVAEQVDELARTEPPARDLRSEPTHATQYVALIGGRMDAGPVFTFPDVLARPADVVPLENLSPLERHFRGWSADELPESSPIMAITDQGDAVSVCFCARRSPVAAEAGVETASGFRGRGLAARVTAAWALAVRGSGRIALYSTSWNNPASLAVARKLALDACGSDWSLSE